MVLYNIPIVTTDSTYDITNSISSIPSIIKNTNLINYGHHLTII